MDPRLSALVGIGNAGADLPGAGRQWRVRKTAMTTNTTAGRKPSGTTEASTTDQLQLDTFTEPVLRRARETITRVQQRARAEVREA